MPTISVVMATYNRGRHILPSVRSVLGQRFTDFELLIVGDHCTDDTAKIVAPYLSDRVRWINLDQRMGSQSGPNNEGISQSRGRYVAYIGHDDIWMPDHLGALVQLLASGADVAVSGTIFHGPRGSNYRQITGTFDSSDAAFEHFFPPSSLAHRRDLTERIGKWMPPHEIRAPVDADLLLRAAGAGMRFASTNRVTVHKFAAGHRYLSYMRHESGEQERMLRLMASPRHQDFVQREVERAKAAGTFMCIRHGPADKFQKGQLARENAMRKGNIRPDLAPLAGRTLIVQDKLPRGLDWQLPSGPDGRFRFAQWNPRPKILIPHSKGGLVRIDIELAHPKPDGLRKLDIAVNGRRRKVRLSAPRKQGDFWLAEAMLLTRLRRDDYTILELRLSRSQRTIGSRLGLGVGDISLEPFGLSALSAALREFAAKRLRRPSN